MGNWITSKAAASSSSEAASQNHLFLIISQENAGDRVVLLVKLQTDCSEQPFCDKCLLVANVTFS